MRVAIFIVLVICVTCGNAGRKVVKTITVDNGGEWGWFRNKEFCPEGQFAIGYKLKLESNQGSGDDTALNAIKLLCGTSTERDDNGYTIISGMGNFGDWYGSFTKCQPGEYLTAFKLQVKQNQGSGDDTAANFVSFQCRSFDGMYKHEINQSPGYGLWGDWGDWSSSCLPGSNICGIQTKIEPYQGSGSVWLHDDTFLNDVKFQCCRADENMEINEYK